MNLRSYYTSGFTLIEVLLSIVIIALIGGFSAPVFQSFQVKNDIHVAADEIVQTMRRAQVLAQASDGDQSWGVDVRTGSITLFQGTDYLSRNSDLDEIFNLPNSITPSGMQETVFTKFSGIPETTGTLTLSSTLNDVQNITITAKGTIHY